MLSGPNVANHRASFVQLIRAGAARIEADGSELAGAVGRLVGSPELEAMREAARRARG